jgi:hypothetical protein
LAGFALVDSHSILIRFSFDLRSYFPDFIISYSSQNMNAIPRRMMIAHGTTPRPAPATVAFFDPAGLNLAIYRY